VIKASLSTTGELGRLLKAWRGMRNKSQEALSFDTGISQRHLSYIESGRSSPSRHTLMAVADGLDMPFRERNQLLLAAGYAPQYQDDVWDAQSLSTVQRALERMLAQHEPYPALVMDRYWNVVMANDAVRQLFGRFIDLDRWPRPRNVLHLLFDPQGLRPFVGDWPAFSRAMLQRVRREAVGGLIDDRLHELIAALRAYPDVDEGAVDGDAAELPVVPLTFLDGELRLSYFSLVTTVGTPRAPGPQELRLECLCPVDELTESWHRS
jgi:transcriptional regulator with XRE-family HTH domain